MGLKDSLVAHALVHHEHQDHRYRYINRNGNT